MNTPLPKPVIRPRRLRRNPAIRRIVRETRLHRAHLIQPMFIVPGLGVQRPVVSMPGIEQHSIDQALREAERIRNLDLGGIILFGIPESKDPLGSDAYDEQGIVQRAAREIKKEIPDLYVIADVCLCEFTDHAHCGQLKGHDVDNDATLELLGRTATSLADAGVDMVAPSGMMDGMVAAIRSALDRADHSAIPILSYAVKYASAYYGPFRDAADNTPSFGDRRAYQMDPANRREALREATLDVEEGADMLMVKPALAYLDIVRDLKERFDLPIAAYNVSGEYAMIKAAAENGWIDEERLVMESLISMRRAGADMILTYHAEYMAERL
ncbi:MAG: porphobilinogen synthase [Magnetococcales bacterium]|nr:porphobilinogen synthase [Magnetococcales bacterium]